MRDNVLEMQFLKSFKEILCEDLVVSVSQYSRYSSSTETYSSLQNTILLTFLKKEIWIRDIQTQLNSSGLCPPIEVIASPHDLICWLLTQPANISDPDGKM